jgi:hypothetical protein
LDFGYEATLPDFAMALTPCGSMRSVAFLLRGQMQGRA